MNTTMHYSDEDLTTYVINPAHVAERERMESHLDGCPECRATVTSLEEVEEDLRNPGVWQQVDGFLARPARLEETLRLMATIDQEDLDAALMIELDLGSPKSFASLRITRAARYRTAGVVRLL